MKYGVVIKEIGHIQSIPQNNSENSDEVLLGMNVKIIKKIKNNWYYIRTHYNYEGYINGEELLIDDSISKRWQKCKNVVAAQGFGDVLDIPKAEGHQIANFTRGAQLISTNVLCSKKKFVKVELPNGKFGWVRKEFLEELKTTYDVTDEDNLRESLVRSAFSYIGTQYRWGGKSPLGIDCSGLCSMAYMLNGIIIYRDAKIKEGFPIKRIPIDKMKKGDLLFFPGHVAMYLGNYKYIHASHNNDVVRVNSFNKNDEDYYEYLDGKLEMVGTIF